MASVGRLIRFRAKAYQLQLVRQFTKLTPMGYLQMWL
jgi:hypothetical protein